MKKKLLILPITSILGLTSSMIPLVSCGNQPKPQPTPIIGNSLEWDFCNNEFYVPQVNPLETEQSFTAKEALNQYLTIAKDDPSALLDDLMFQENLTYSQFVTSKPIKKYEVKYEIVDVNPENSTISLNYSYHISIDYTIGTLDVDCEYGVRNIPFMTYYDYSKFDGIAIPCWSFVPIFYFYSDSQFADMMSKIDNWSTTEGSYYYRKSPLLDTIEYDLGGWNKNNIESKYEQIPAAIDCFTRCLTGAIQSSYFAWVDRAQDNDANRVAETNQLDWSGTFDPKLYELTKFNFNTLPEDQIDGVTDFTITITHGMEPVRLEGVRCRFCIDGLYYEKPANNGVVKFTASDNVTLSTETECYMIIINNASNFDYNIKTDTHIVYAPITD